MPEIDRVKFGIQGLDKALNSGIPKGNLVLVSGGAGTGKTTFSLQFLVNGALLFGEKGLYISTEQNVSELRKAAANFGWKLEELEKSGMVRLKYLNILKGDSFLKNIRAECEDFQPKRVVIDSLTTLTDSILVTDLKEDIAFSVVQVAETVNPIPRTERIVAKTILYHLIDALRAISSTVLLTSELLEDEKGLSADEVSEFITDGVIILYYFGVGATEARSMIIRKMRYTAHEKKSILYDIFNDGIRVVSEEEAYKL
ncbi:MAG: AAA family ATPase [Candidatus Diapherotrites archaeon]|uniref:AAA family ATPase n=1 Tax=Candidatus Iainarchaeum sp. TaxID=3101447 RepID=A0A7J4KRU3_9ARCH|nr:MAG: hypothetical protein QT12_C0023G0008 [archaeon GW2011_AR21]MBS3057789.1 AAA family ATPase [Candidatus Diapherotrites archaeon]HIH32751.1 AAA family ATPase [Candidatus Diapherotrites archaeon]